MTQNAALHPQKTPQLCGYSKKQPFFTCEARHPERKPTFTTTQILPLLCTYFYTLFLQTHPNFTPQKYPRTHSTTQKNHTTFRVHTFVRKNTKITHNFTHIFIQKHNPHRTHTFLTDPNTTPHTKLTKISSTNLPKNTKKPKNTPKYRSLSPIFTIFDKKPHFHPLFVPQLFTPHVVLPVN